MWHNTRDDLIAKFENDVAKRSRGLRLLLAIDQLFSVLIWNSSQDETISSRVGRRIADGEAFWIEKKLCSVLRLFESKHCIKSEGE